jgi:Asp-tRNA(Asn)/Glu-tRNA(Gln) amidotransferase A subunit family amidase
LVRNFSFDHNNLDIIQGPD